MKSDERIIRALMESVREDIRAPESLRADVMRRVHAIRVPVWRRALDWVLRPRTLRLSPAGGLAAAGALAVVLYLGIGSMGGGTPADAPVAQENDEPAPTRFVFIAPEASTVEMTGDFADWDPGAIRLRDERGTGVWIADVPLEPGVYQYVFIVDGQEWRPDPQAVSQVEDGFGRENSVVIVSEAVEL